MNSSVISGNILDVFPCFLTPPAYLHIHILDFKQPHLQRTKLCDMKDGELDPSYVKKREKLKEIVASIIRPKIVHGKSMNGKEFVSFLEQVRDSNI